MAEQLFKLTVSQVNSLLNSDYNMISFDSLSRDELLQIFFNCLNRMEVLPKVDVLNNVGEALSKLIKLLTDIKAPSAVGARIDEFTNGFIQGKRKLLMATLFWMLSNQEEVKKRMYLSKYLTKVDLNDAALSEPEVQTLLRQYEDVLQHFKRVYTQSSKYSKIATATTQLRNAIEKQNKDMANIADLLSKQTAKMENIPNKEALLISVRAMRTEMLADKQLAEQLLLQTETVVELKRKLHDYRSRVGGSVITRSHDTGTDVMSRLQDEVRVARALIASGGSSAVEEEVLRDRLRVCETVVRSSNEQTDEKQLHEHVERVRRELAAETQRQMEEHAESGNGDTTNDERLIQYRRHASHVANNRRVTANKLTELRSEIEAMRQQLMEREMRIREAVGAVGARLPHGDDLRQFVGGLRGQGNAYKEARARLHELQAETGVLARSRDLLLQMEPQLNKQDYSLDVTWLQDRDRPTTATTELRRTCAKLVADVRRLRVDVAQLSANVRERTKDLPQLQDTHQQQKQIFDSSLKDNEKKVTELQEEINRIEDNITKEENRWKLIRSAIEENENLLDRFFEESHRGKRLDIAKPTAVESLNEKLASEEKRRSQLQDEMSQGKRDKVEGEEQTAAWHATLSLLRSKGGPR